MKRVQERQHWERKREHDHNYWKSEHLSSVTRRFTEEDDKESFVSGEITLEELLERVEYRAKTQKPAEPKVRIIPSQRRSPILLIDKYFRYTSWICVLPILIGAIIHISLIWVISLIIGLVAFSIHSLFDSILGLRREMK